LTEASPGAPLAGPMEICYLVGGRVRPALAGRGSGIGWCVPNAQTSAEAAPTHCASGMGQRGIFRTMGRMSDMTSQRSNSSRPRSPPRHRRARRSVTTQNSARPRGSDCRSVIPSPTRRIPARRTAVPIVRGDRLLRAVLLRLPSTPQPRVAEPARAGNSRPERYVNSLKWHDSGPVARARSTSMGRQRN
jgi:hypothetical protein